ncbi:hypothetical protein CABS01_14563 [Colletotrichum abscissum]|uniref:Uncharacterized protein n=2 Tax=Colletotrichum acutatum species complex TaxID=2707335 RepID=A0A9Q0B216_9PEZI|nr:uncharacterized protein CLUP02_14906 [Colletotrichum lupini]XP_060393213.1 uncharacterized protein CABS01_14563 [Colletotrichum abscissum]KAI3545502.1 hypothetical protein CABS02_09335 [Colletotrichum abscissum]KAK1479464.1 hypothetical protein CABS01_14563 [Colletotrichum abscissum]KAK1720714.1 hypothetical protein BDP67DRAFT_73432 [Colletotrichum lupini]UQC89377.1 hypothetical protein CLUP02_14906 [Colletotrichum lupini]
MSGMHSTFSSSITGDTRHSYALLSAIQEGSKASSSSSASYSSPYQKEADAASMSSFGSSMSLLKSKLNKHSAGSARSSSSSSSKKSSSLIARQRAAEDANTQIMYSQAAYWPSSIRTDL